MRHPVTIFIFILILGIVIVTVTFSYTWPKLFEFSMTSGVADLTFFGSKVAQFQTLISATVAIFAAVLTSSALYFSVTYPEWQESNRRAEEQRVKRVVGASILSIEFKMLLTRLRQDRDFITDEFINLQRELPKEGRFSTILKARSPKVDISANLLNFELLQTQEPSIAASIATVLRKIPEVSDAEVYKNMTCERLRNCNAISQSEIDSKYRSLIDTLDSVVLSMERINTQL